MLSGRKVKFGRILSLLAAPLALPAPAAGQCSYSVEIVYGPPGPGGGETSLRTEGLNEKGGFTGWYTYAVDVQFAFRWAALGGVETLAFPPTFDWNPHAMDITNIQMIAGWVINTTGHQQPFIWNKGQVTELASPDNAHAVAYGLNEAGLVVGGAPDPVTGEWRPAFWEDGVLTVLSILDDYGFAEDVSANGVIVGHFGIGPPTHFSQRGFVWDHGNLTILPPIPGGVTSSAFALSERGFVTGAGSVWDPATQSHRARAFVWNQGSMINLGTVGESTQSIGSDVNSSGQVVGHCLSPTTPFLWQQGVMRDLRELVDPAPGVEVDVRIAQVVNDNGIIIARGDADDMSATFILTPRHVAGDLNFDCTVNVLDLLEMLGQWGDGQDMPADFNHDGTVNVHDLIYLLTHWGPG